MRCLPFVYYHVHAVNTTGMHAAERRRFDYADACAQCGAALDAGSRVASHVLTYPCFPYNCCFARLSLQTCCRSCNGRHMAREAGACCVPGFAGASPGTALDGGRWVVQCCCVVYAAPNGQRG